MNTFNRFATFGVIAIAFLAQVGCTTDTEGEDGERTGVVESAVTTSTGQLSLKRTSHSAVVISLQTLRPLQAPAYLGGTFIYLVPNATKLSGTITIGGSVAGTAWLQVPPTMWQELVNTVDTVSANQLALTLTYDDVTLKVTGITLKRK